MISMSYSSGSKLWMKKKQKTCRVVTVIRTIGTRVFARITNLSPAVSNTQRRFWMVELASPIQSFRVIREC